MDYAFALSMRLSVELLASLSLVLAGAYAFLRASQRRHLKHVESLRSLLEVQRGESKEKDVRIPASITEIRGLQKQLLDCRKRAEILEAEKKTEALALMTECDCIRRQLRDTNMGASQEQQEKGAQILTMAGENERLQNQLADLRQKHGGLETKAYTTILALANGNSALHRQIEALRERNDGLEAHLVEVDYDSRAEIAQLRLKVRSAEQNSLQQTAQFEARLEAMEATMNARDARATKEVEDVRNTYAKEVLELRDKLSEYHHLLNGDFTGGTWSLPLPILPWGRKPKPDELEYTRALGHSYKAAYSAPERL